MGLAKGETDYEENDLEEVKKLVKSATRDCVAEQRNSFVAFQAKTGVEVTFSYLLIYVLISFAVVTFLIF